MDLRRSALRTLFFGLSLVALFWPLNWLLEQTHLLFFPLWLGYVLTVDGLVRLRTGTSLLARHPRTFVALFPALRARLVVVRGLQRTPWQLGVPRCAQRFSDFEYFVLASVSFSTVIPAVFESAELRAQLPLHRTFRARAGVPARRRHAGLPLDARGARSRHDGLDVVVAEAVLPVRVDRPRVPARARAPRPRTARIHRRPAARATGARGCPCGSVDSCAGSFFLGDVGTCGASPSGSTTCPTSASGRCSRCRCWVTSGTCRLRWGLYLMAQFRAAALVSQVPLPRAPKVS